MPACGRHCALWAVHAVSPGGIKKAFAVSFDSLLCSLPLFVARDI